MGGLVGGVPRTGVDWVRASYLHQTAFVGVGWAGLGWAGLVGVWGEVGGGWGAREHLNYHKTVSLGGKVALVLLR